MSDDTTEPPEGYDVQMLRAQNGVKAYRGNVQFQVHPTRERATADTHDHAERQRVIGRAEATRQIAEDMRTGTLGDFFDEAVVEHRAESAQEALKKAVALWRLLDDIDTASDRFKDDYAGLAKYVYAKQQERHAILNAEDVGQVPSEVNGGPPPDRPLCDVHDRLLRDELCSCPMGPTRYVRLQESPVTAALKEYLEALGPCEAADDEAGTCDDEECSYCNLTRAYGKGTEG